jgi:ADP-ribose 1''-phosphate phosphatase
MSDQRMRSKADKGATSSGTNLDKVVSSRVTKNQAATSTRKTNTAGANISNAVKAGLQKAQAEENGTDGERASNPFEDLMLTTIEVSSSEYQESEDAGGIDFDNVKHEILKSIRKLKQDVFLLDTDGSPEVLKLVDYVESDIRELERNVTPATALAVLAEHNGFPKRRKVHRTSPLRKLELTEIVGDLFNAAENSVLIHACNRFGSWDGGIAKSFKKYYPEAFKAFKRHCHIHGKNKLPGSALLIPPIEAEGRRRHYVGCLFTSRSGGHDEKAEALDSTLSAVEDLLVQVSDKRREGDQVGELAMCKINDGIAVPWKKTAQTLRGLKVKDDEASNHITVYALD